MRILHAPGEIAGQMGILSRAQRELGYNSYSCSFSNTWLAYSVDHTLNLEQAGSKFRKGLRMLQFFPQAAASHDVFHFHAGHTLLPWYADLPLLRAMGKRMVMNYWGSDVRQKSIAEKRNSYLWPIASDERSIIRRIRTVSRYIETAIVGSEESSLYIRDYFRKVAVIRAAIDLDQYELAVPAVANKRLVIVHAPTNQVIKGTEFVLKAVTRLEKEHAVEFTLVHGVPHEQAKVVYERADIVVDQLRAGAHGVFALEAMALGKPVICYISDERRREYPVDLPIVSADPDTVYDKLKMLLENPALRHELGVKGRQYVEKYHDSRIIAQQLIDLYKTL